jgi:glycosyltransferase involved in cell wall biosynthesis
VLDEDLAPGVSVIVPVFRGAATIDELVRRVLATMRPLGVAYEVVLVNDGSPDESWVRMVALSDAEPSVRGIDLLRNFGQHNALLAGVRSARYTVVVTLDDDLQHPPEEIPRLLAALTGDVDVVYATAAKTRQPLLRSTASLITRIMLQRMMGIEEARHVSAFRAFRTRVRGAFEEFSLPEFSLDVLLSWGTQRFTAITVEHHPRKHGTSNYTTRSLLRHSINMVIGSTAAPLRVASVLGFTMFGLGIGLLAYVLANYVIRGSPVPGFAFIAASVAVLGGVQLFVLGVIGEYLAKVFQRSMGKPPYAVRAFTAGGSP